MKALSLWQPWASLIALKEKKIETRSWKAPDYLIGHRIAIHATKSMPVWVRALLRGFAKLLGIKKYEGSWLYYLAAGVGPFGKVVATAKLVDCSKVIEESAYPPGESVLLENGMYVRGNELSFGDYAIGRYAWILEDIQPLKEPVPARGMQGLWEWKEGEGII
jgi:hypothetical protein